MAVDRTTGEVIPDETHGKGEFDRYRAGKILTLLPKVAEELGVVEKEGKNPGLKYPYREIKTIVIRLAPILRKHGVTMVPRVEQFQRESFASASGTHMMNVTVVVSYRFYADDGSFVECSAIGEASDSGDKGAAKAMTAAWKAALIQALNIPEGEDTEAQGEATRATPASRGAAPPAGTKPAAAAARGAPAAGVPNWWVLQKENPEAQTTAVDDAGDRVPVNAVLKFPPNVLPLAGSKDKPWEVFGRGPAAWTGKSWKDLLLISVAARRAATACGGALIPEECPFETILTTNGRGAYKGKANWNGEQAAFLAAMADILAARLAGASAEKAPTPAQAPAAPPQEAAEAAGAGHMEGIKHEENCPGDDLCLCDIPF